MRCPRCGSEQIDILTNSPVGDVWKMFICEKCFYSWRSTEKVHILEKFKLSDSALEKMQVIPPVPPLDESISALIISDGEEEMNG